MSPIPLLSEFDGRNAFDFLNSAELAVAAATLGVLTVPARDELLLLICVNGYSSGDIASLRFNGDTGANYSSRYLSSVAGGVVWVSNQNVSQTLARMFALTTTSGRHAIVGIKNKLNAAKIGNVSGQTGVTSAATGLQLEIGGFQWQNTTAQITSVEMRTAGGQNMTAGSSIVILGRDTP